MKYFMTLSTYVGIYKLTKTIYKMSNFARKYGHERAKEILSLEESKSLFHTYGGGWAVVTGGTSGLGYKIVKILMKQGFNICIVDKDPEALDMAKKKLDFKSQNSKQIKVLQLDFTKLKTL
jgi:NADPH:quinone reductase-like Zn-dependent oxidoreductase